MILRLFVLTLVLLAPLGCGSSTSTGVITGKVTVGGRALKGGSISFQSVKANSLPLTFEIQADGSYEARDVPYGELMISIVPPPPSGTVSVSSAASAKERMGELERAGQPIPRELSLAASGIGPGGSGQKPGEMNSKYNDPFSSGLTYTLSEPSAVHNVDIP